MTEPRPCRATAHSNIALVKYWGKRDVTNAELNLPAVGSLSMTLDQLRSVTQIRPAERDEFRLDGVVLDGKPASKVFEQLDCVVARRSHGYAAALLGRLDQPLADCRRLGQLGIWLRRAHRRRRGLLWACSEARWPRARPLVDVVADGLGQRGTIDSGGFVRLDAGTTDDGSDCVARPLFPASHWDVRLLVVHTARGAKSVGSTGGMEASRSTSPYYGAWVETSAADLDAAERALAERNFESLGEVMEHSCFKMHACMLATRPPLMYWNGTTLEVIRAVWRLRESGGPPGFVTSDAGPHVKVLCRAAHAAALAESLATVAGVHEVEVVAPGPDASLELG